MLRRVLLMFMLAWVLWIEHKTADVSSALQTRTWVPEGEYRDDAYAQCVQDARALAKQNVESSTKVANVKRAESSQRFEGISVRVDYTTGGTSWFTYQCLADTAKPE